MPIQFIVSFLLIVILFDFLNIKIVKIENENTFEDEMYYVREYTPTCRFSIT